MRKAVFIYSIILSTLTFAQNQESSTQYEREYSDLMNYVPKNFKSDTIYKPESPFIKVKLNTLGRLKTYSGFRSEFKLTEKDIKWLEMRIYQMSTALFLDGKRILISSDGGYSGCQEKSIDKLTLNGIQITNLKLCHTCTDGYKDKRFIKIFNDRMYELMKIEPPNRKTQFFYGEFKGIGKKNYGIKLILTQDRTFKFWKTIGHSSEFTEGLWKNKNDILILTSKILNKTDSLNFALSSSKWIDFKELEFRLNKEKLTELKNKKRKLLKIYK